MFYLLWLAALLGLAVTVYVQRGLHHAREPASRGPWTQILLLTVGCLVATLCLSVFSRPPRLALFFAALGVVHLPGAGILTVKHLRETGV